MASSRAAWRLSADSAVNSEFVEPVQLELFSELPRTGVSRPSAVTRRASHETTPQPLLRAFDAEREPLFHFAFMRSKVVDIAAFTPNAAQSRASQQHGALVSVVPTRYWPLLDKELLSLFRNGGETQVARTIADCIYLCYMRNVFYVGDFVGLDTHQVSRLGPDWAVDEIYAGIRDLDPLLRPGAIARGWRGPHLRNSHISAPKLQLPAHRRWWEGAHWRTQTLRSPRDGS